MQSSMIYQIVILACWRDPQEAVKPIMPVLKLGGWRDDLYLGIWHPVTRVRGRTIGSAMEAR